METTNVIVDYYSFKEQHITYQGLEEASTKAFEYIIYGYMEQHPFSEIIKNMPEHLGYTLHPHSFLCAFNIMSDQMPDDHMKSQFVDHLKKMDDLGFFVKESTEIELTENSIKNYLIFEVKNNYSYIDIKPKFELSIPSPEPTPTPTIIPPEPTSTLSTPPKQEDIYITLPVKDPEPDHPSWYTTEFQFDSENKKILLYTIIAFLAIKAIAYYFKDDGKKDNIQAPDESSMENEVLHNVSETLYFDVTLVYKMLLGFIPISLLIIYKLRYYYYYRLYAALNKIKWN